MKKILLLLAMLLSAPATAQPLPHWTDYQVERLIAWMSTASDEGLTSMASEVPALRAVAQAGESQAVDDIATAAAVRLLNGLRQGCCNASLRSGWHIDQAGAWPDAKQAVAQAIATNQLDALFTRARPGHPNFVALRNAYMREVDPAKKATLAANLDRWRWMPRELGARYLLVNTAAFEATLWEEGRILGRWNVVVGKTKSPTPIFRATVTGVTFNPWWEIPPSIAREGIAGMVAKNPSAAARRGYVLQGGRYRQKPGPNNALGRMKLVMPNAFSVYLHDTPAQSLFNQEVRAYSHGCVRVGDALGLATALLSGSGNWSREETDRAVSSGVTRTVPLERPIPVYIAYFTAEPADTGLIRYFKDVYHRDAGAAAPKDDGTCP